MINAGFFVLSPRVLEYLKDDGTIWEREPLARLAADDQLMAYEHEAFGSRWTPCANRTYLEELWSSGKAPWKVWDCAP